MIIHTKGTKEQPSLIDLLGGESKPVAASGKANGMFAKLLAALGKGDGSLDRQNGAEAFKTVVDPKKRLVTAAEPLSHAQKSKTAATAELQALLEGFDKGTDEQAVSTELLRNLSNDQVRTLIHRAKEYLRNEITAKVSEFRNDTQSLPKSLMGLIHLAEKLELDPQSVTLSTLFGDADEMDSLPKEFLSQPLLNPKALPETVSRIEDAGAISQLLGQIKTKVQAAPSDNKGETTAQEGEPLKALLTQSITEEDSVKKPLSARVQAIKPEAEHMIAANPMLQGSENKRLQTPAGGVQTPKPDTASVSPLPQEMPRTEEKHSHTAGAQNAGTGALMALLRGENDSSEPSSEHSKGTPIEGETSKAVSASKPDSLEVKAKEAQQSMRHFSADLKEAVENYKPPFTRLSIKLNPEKLGEVEVTLVQRGNNVHVNIQSNNAGSIAFLAHNATELKAQLAHQGITNATMNFMGGGENPHGQQQQQHHSGDRFRAYTSFEELELNEEQLGALEIIIPHYA